MKRQRLEKTRVARMTLHDRTIGNVTIDAVWVRSATEREQHDYFGGREGEMVEFKSGGEAILTRPLE